MNDVGTITFRNPLGGEDRPVQVEVDVHNGLPQTQTVGLPDAAVRESRERVRAALKNCGFDLPPRAVTINLAPADLRKEGNHLDLAIAELASSQGLREVFLPEASSREGASSEGVAVIPLCDLPSAIDHLLERRLIPPASPILGTSPTSQVPDLADVRGQTAARRALEVAAAGGHNLLGLCPDLGHGAGGFWRTILE